MYPPVKERIEREFSVFLQNIIKKLDRELPPKTCFTVNEVSEILGVSGKTVRRWLKQGKLQAFKTEATWRITREELLRFIAERSNWLLP